MVTAIGTPGKQTYDYKRLENIFEEYCQFGNHVQPAHSPITGKPIPVCMDGAKFAKLVREAGLLDQQLMTSVEVDIIFNKIKDNGLRKISFEQFLDSLRMIGEKKFGADGFDLVCQSIQRLQGPKLSPGTTVNHKRVIFIFYELLDSD